MKSLKLNLLPMKNLLIILISILIVHKKLKLSENLISLILTKLLTVYHHHNKPRYIIVRHCLGQL